jgi:hypothetical protein
MSALRLLCCLLLMATAPQPVTFVLELDTSGGFTGRGRGGVTIGSDGTVRASRVGGTNREASACRGQLGADEISSLQKAVAGATQQPWPASFAPAGDMGCCDRMKWTLRVDARADGNRAETFSTSWYDGNEQHMPKELTAVRDGALAALKQTLATCRQ